MHSGTHRISLHLNHRRDQSTVTIYQLTDRLHSEHTALVPGHAIAATVSSWLAQLGAESPLVDDLAHAVQAGDWPTMYALGEKLSVEIAVAAQSV